MEENHEMQVEDPVLETGNATEDDEEHEDKVPGGSENETMEETIVPAEKPSGRGRGRRKNTAVGDSKGEKKGRGQKRAMKEPATPLVNRPPRERKSIERFASSVEKEKVREFKIPKGAGTCLKDIPNIVFKLSKRKGSEETVQLLHKLLYGKRIKPHSAKPNILQFSGYVWSANEEKEKTKVKERLEKCVKDNLLQLSDILDLNVPRATSKKEDVVVKLLEFLELPHKTTERIYQEEEQKAKSRKRKTPTKGVQKRMSAQTPRKRQKQDKTRPLKKSKDDEDDEDQEDEPDAEEIESEEAPSKKRRSITSNRKDVKELKSPTKKQSKQEFMEDDEEDDEGNTTRGKTPSRAASRKQAPKLSKTPAQSPRKEERKKTSKEDKMSSAKADKKSNSSVYSRNENKEKGEEVREVQKNGKPKKGKGRGRSNAKGSKSTHMPSDEELCAAISKLLRDVDFSTVTFTDVVEQLGKKFGVDLGQNKSHVKILIKEEIKKIIDEDGEGDGEDEGEGDGDGDGDGEGDNEGDGKGEGDREGEGDGEDDDDNAENKDGMNEKDDDLANAAAES